MKINSEHILLLSLVAAPALLKACAPVKKTDKPNFIVIIADDVSWDDFGCYGNSQVKTPNIDRLAASGLKFNNFFLTASSSSPSRNSIITGRYPHNTGGAELHAEPPDYMVSFPEVLKNGGYYTGLVYEELVRQGVAENTVIIVMADNGRPFSHSKTRVNDRGLKSPFIIHWPAGSGTKSRECNSLVSSVDIAPTILKLASLEIPESVQGVSFTQLLKQPGKDFRNYVFAEHNWHDYEAHERMVRTKDYLYILNSRPQFPQLGPADAIGSPSFSELDSLRKVGGLTFYQAEIFISPRPDEELYNCNADPEQFTNIAGSPQYKSELDNLRQVLTEWMEVTGDNIPEELTKDWYHKEPGL